MKPLYRLVGFAQHVPVYPAFVMTIFERDGKQYIQSIDGDCVTDFVAMMDSNELQRVDCNVNVSVGDDAIYGFAWSSNEFAFGTRRELGVSLLNATSPNRSAVLGWTYLRAEMEAFAREERANVFSSIVPTLARRVKVDQRDVLAWFQRKQRDDGSDDYNTFAATSDWNPEEMGIPEDLTAYYLFEVGNVPIPLDQTRYYVIGIGSAGANHIAQLLELEPATFGLTCKTLSDWLADCVFWEGRSNRELSLLFEQKLPSEPIVLPLLDHSEPMSRRIADALAVAVERRNGIVIKLPYLAAAIRQTGNGFSGRLSAMESDLMRRDASTLGRSRRRKWAQEFVRRRPGDKPPK